MTLLVPAPARAQSVAPPAQTPVSARLHGEAPGLRFQVYPADPPDDSEEDHPKGADAGGGAEAEALTSKSSDVVFDDATLWRFDLPASDADVAWLDSHIALEQSIPATLTANGMAIHRQPLPRGGWDVSLTSEPQDIFVSLEKGAIPSWRLCQSPAPPATDRSAVYQNASGLKLRHAGQRRRRERPLSRRRDRSRSRRDRRHRVRHTVRSTTQSARERR